jgi:hypothetical protein
VRVWSICQVQTWQTCLSLHSQVQALLRLIVRGVQPGTCAFPGGSTGWHPTPVGVLGRIVPQPRAPLLARSAAAAQLPAPVAAANALTVPRLLRWRRVDRWRAGEGREPPFVCAAIGCVSAQWLQHRRHWASTSASAGQPTAGGRTVVCARGLAAHCSRRSLVKVRQATQQSADRSTQRRGGHRRAVHSAGRRWVASHCLDVGATCPHTPRVSLRSVVDIGPGPQK